MADPRELTGTVADVALLFSVTEKTIRQWIRDEGLPIIKAGRRGPGGATQVSLPDALSWWLERGAVAAGDLDPVQERARRAAFPFRGSRVLGVLRKFERGDPNYGGGVACRQLLPEVSQ